VWHGGFEIRRGGGGGVNWDGSSVRLEGQMDCHAVGMVQKPDGRDEVLVREIQGVVIRIGK